MAPLELAKHLRLALGSLLSLEERVRYIVKEELARALALGYDADSLSAGPLQQWAYVLATHVAAAPAPQVPAYDEQALGAQARYLDYLMAQILSDARFVAEMRLDWSAAWLLGASRSWERLLDTVRIVNAEVPPPDRLAAIRRALIAARAQLGPRD
jgi:hypothetical protein